MSPLSLSRQSSMEQMLSPMNETCSLLSVQSNCWQAFCECEMVVNLQTCGVLELSSDTSEGQTLTISYEIIADPNWAISGNKTGQYDPPAPLEH